MDFSTWNPGGGEEIRRRNQAKMTAAFPHSIELGKLGATLPDRALEDTVSVEGLKWEVMYIRAEANLTGYSVNNKSRLINYCTQRLRVLSNLYKDQLDSCIMNVLENNKWYVETNQQRRFPLIKSGDVLLVRPIIDHGDDDHVNTYRIVGWGMPPDLGLNVIYCITRLLAWKHKALTRFYAPDGTGFPLLQAAYAAEF